jgi:sortase A
MFAATVTPVSDSGSVSQVAFAADFTNANAWFPTSPQKKIVTPVNTYTLSIPKLRIANAMVTVAGDDLAESLVHYGGTALPGEYGNTVIFGHSTLTQFYNPKDYKTIFSLLPTMKSGDEIDITYDGISYVYKVFDMVVSEPSDLSALEQKFDDSYLTLITCVPPGTYWQRLHVRARLVRPAV